MITLKKRLLQEIIAHCREAHPKEACGILAGRPKQRIGPDDGGESADIQKQDGKVSKSYRMANTSETPEVCYFMDPTEQLKVFKEMRRSGTEMVGIYHSHAASPAYPSQRDCEMAFYPEAAYVIVSLQDVCNPVVRAFELVEGRIEEIRIEAIGGE